MSKVDANDVSAEAGPEAVRGQLEAGAAAARSEAAQQAGWASLGSLRQKHGGRLRAPIIEGLLRRGEICNIIAPPKAGKSWLTYGLACAVVGGGYFLGHEEWKCAPGKVAIIDNELHEETIQYRVPLVAAAMGIDPEIAYEQILVCSLRGKQRTMESMAQVIRHLSRLKPQLVVLDAFYRFLPKGTSENDNADMVQLYNQIDGLASQIDSSLVVVHHTTKGSQHAKEVMDLGAGAGAQGRAADTHLALREHEEPGHYVVESRLRTWPMADPYVVRFDFPVWVPAAQSIDASQLKGSTPATQQMTRMDPLDDAAFATYLDGTWLRRNQVIDGIRRIEGCSRSHARDLVRGVVERHDLDVITQDDGERDCGPFLCKKHGMGIVFQASSR